MSLWEKHLGIVFSGKDDDEDDLSSATVARNTLISIHNHGLPRLSNRSSQILLEQRLYEYSRLTSCNSKPNSINNFAKPIKNLLARKVSTRHCAAWESNLKESCADALTVLNNNLKASNYCDVKSGCKADSITENNIQWLLDNKNNSSVQLKRKIITKPSNVILSKEPTSNSATSSSSNFNNDSTTNNSKPFYGFTSSNEKPKIDNVVQKPFSSFAKSSFTKNKSNFNIPKIMDENDSNNSKQTPKAQEFFRTARDEYHIQNKKKNCNNVSNTHQSYRPIENNPVLKRSLGTTRSSVKSKFIPPIPTKNKEEENIIDDIPNSEECEDERLKNIDPKMVEMIRNEIIDTSAPVDWDDIAGLDFAKVAIQEAVVWPLLRPDIFTGLRRPPKGILLFGPPGTGKTLIGKCIASQSCATFFSISASSLTSKWIGDGEKMVRALFAVARCHQPAVIFIDEIDSLLIQRSDGEHEATRRMKTEFLVQLDGAATSDEDRLLVIGATNRPQELDEAARRRMVKRLYIPLPDLKARIHLINRLMRTERNSLTEDEVANVAELADGYSGADMRSLCSEAALGPIRSVPFSQITNISNEQVRAVTVEDFKKALVRVRPSVSQKDLEHYVKWDLTYGSGSNSN